MPGLWLKIFLLPPELLQRHAQGYAELASLELTQHACQIKTRFLLWTVGAFSILMGLGFGGVSVLLWSALPQMNTQKSWVLLALPLSFCLVGLVSTWAAGHLKIMPLFPKLQQQLHLDMLSLQQTEKR